MTPGRRIACWVLRAAFIAALSAGSAAAAETRGVIELFTSQGCSSCPAADKLMAEFARDPSLVVISAPIDYWDYLGWRDTLAKPRHAARQRGYAKRRGDRELYTPQAIINGATHVLGSDRAAIERALASTKDAADTLTVPVEIKSEGGKLHIGVGERRAETPAEVWLCALSRSVPVDIGRGENSGRTVTYSNVIRRWMKLGDWSGSALSFELPTGALAAEGADAVAVLVQAGTVENPGAMLGAAQASLR